MKRVGWGRVIATGLLGACGGTSLPTRDAGADGMPVLSLTVSTKLPVLEGLALTSGEIELEHVGLYGDSDHDDDSDVPRITFQLGTRAQTLVYSTAPPGLYSRLRTEIDHVALVGTWRGTPIQIHTNSEERIVDLAVGEQALSSTTGAPFSLVIDGTTWLAPSQLDAVTAVDGTIEIDEGSEPMCVDSIMTQVVASFAVSDG